jgi:hypothetical protein
VLCIGVGSFTTAGANDEDEPALTAFEDLDYAAVCARELHAALRTTGYDTELLVDPADLGVARLGDRVEHRITGGGVAVVHVLSHGQQIDVGGVYVVGSGGAWSKRTRVED